MALRMATVKTVGQLRIFMNRKTNKRPSSEAMGLWLVSAIMILSVIVTPAHDAQKNTIPANTPTPIPRVMIPSLFPDESSAIVPSESSNFQQAIAPSHGTITGHSSADPSQTSI